VYTIPAILCIAAAGCGQKTKNIGVSLSGTITASSIGFTDSDVNDSFAPYAPNNTPAQAQTVPNPATIGGFVAVPGTVRIGRLAENSGGDIDDYYSLTLLQGQAVTLTISDRYGANSEIGIGEPYVANDVNSPGNDIDLYLLDDSLNNVATADVVNNNLALKSVSAPNTGLYYLRVTAKSGASNYVVNTGLAGIQTAAAVAQSTAPADNNIAIADFVPGEVIVKFKNTLLPVSTAVVHTLASRAASVGMKPKAGAEGRSMLLSLGDSTQKQQAFTTLGIKISRQFSDPVEQSKFETVEVVKALRRRADVQNARPNYIRHATAVPNDTYYGLQWHYDLINLPQAWEVNKGSANVIVAVIDTGILESHPDLAGNIITNGSGGIGGYDFISDPSNAGDGDGIDPNPHDEGDGTTGPSSFHGTHVAGTIAAVTNNSRGVAGVGWNVKIMPLRALGKLGGTEYDIEQAVLYAAGLDNDSGQKPAQKADVINLSLGGATGSTTPPDAFVQARNAGVIIVAAAGNDSSSAYSYPASLDGVVSVSAVDINKKLAFYSNFGSTIDVAAPGGDTTVDLNGDSYPDGVMSTWADDSSGTPVLGYGFLQGTSMASPHVAGVVALMKSVKPDLTPQMFDDYLASTDPTKQLTDDLGAAGRDDSYGYGLIDALKAVQAAGAGAPPPADPVAVSSPRSLVIKNTANSMQFTLSNGGGGSLTNISISNDSNGWLSTSEVAVDQTTGLGTYEAIVDRGMLPTDPTAGALITVSYTATNTSNVSTSGTLTIPLVVYQRAFVANAGFQYVLLFDIDVANWWTQPATRTIAVGNSEGKYYYRINNVPPGRYVITTGSDLNSNDLVCDVGETCGDYPTFGRLQPITVKDSSIQGLDFTVGYNVLIPNARLSSGVAQYSHDGENKSSAVLPVLPQNNRGRPLFVP